jgi:hypothetical protein
LKSYEAFSESVYAKANVKRLQIRRRNARIRNVCVSGACMLVLALAAVPLSRMFEQSPIISQPTTIDQEQVTQPQAGQQDVTLNSPRMVRMDNDSIAVLDGPEDMQAFLNDFREANDICDTESLPVTPTFEGATTIQSAQELAEFIAELPQGAVALQTIFTDYDDAFFLENNLYAMPMGVGTPLDITVCDEPGYCEENGYPLPTRCRVLDCPGCEPLQSQPPIITHSDAYLLLLVPRNK